MPKLELLAIELETFLENPDYAEKIARIKVLAAHARDEQYNQTTLIHELEDNGFRFFANKLRTGYYKDLAELEAEDRVAQEKLQAEEDAKAAKIEAAGQTTTDTQEQNDQQPDGVLD